jgi:hypothetical protein
MKLVLLVSVLLNGFLGWKVLQKKEVVREEIVEKVIVKKSKPEIIEKKIIVQVPGEPAETVAAPKDFDERDMEDVVVDVVKDKEDFLVGKLGFTEREFKEIESVKQRFYDQYQKILPTDQVGTLSLEQRKALLQLEEQRDAEYERAVGPQKWKEWESFRDNYNQKMFKKMMKEKGVIVPMEI